jgi:hypothetical protein
MPLTAKGEAVLQRMKEQYGPKEGESVFYSKINSGDKEAQDWHIKEEKQPEKKTETKPGKKPSTILGGRNLATVRKKQGEGFWQGEID